MKSAARSTCATSETLLQATQVLVLATLLVAPGTVHAASQAGTEALAVRIPATRVQAALDPENWETRDAGLAIAGSGTAGELSAAQIEDRLGAAMREGTVADAYRRRRAYPVLDLAERDVRRGAPDAAIAGYQRYLAEDPRHLVIRWRLIQLLRAGGRDTEVVGNADQLLSALPDFAPALVQKGQALAGLGQASPATDAFVRALRLPNLSPSARREALGGLVNTAISSGRLAEADSQLAAEPLGPPDSAVARSVLAARASLADYAGRPADAAALWGRIAAAASPPERRRALLAQAQLLDQAGRPQKGLELLRADPVATLFAPSSGAPSGTRLRYLRLISVLAERTGQIDTAADAAAQAAALQQEAQGTEGAAGNLVDRMRAARLEQRRPNASPTSVLSFLLRGRQPFDRPADADDATWTDYLLLLADTAQRAAMPALAGTTLDRLAASALQDWRTAARAAEITERTGRPAEAAALWARVAVAAPDAAERRRAKLAQAQLLEQAGSSADALRVLDDPAARALFSEGSGAAPDERLRYERAMSVLAERTGRTDLAREASERAATLQQRTPGEALPPGALVDRMRAARLQAPRDGPSPAALPLLLDSASRPFARPEGIDDALWAEYALLLADTAQRASRLTLTREALDAVPPSALQDWRTAARVGELALAAGRPATALSTLRPWNALALSAAGADRMAVLTVLSLRANAAAAMGDRAAEGATAAEIEAIDPRIGNAPDRAQRLLAARDAQAAVALLEAARPAASARAAGAPAAERPEAQHRLAQLLIALGQAEWQAGRPARALQAFRDSLAAEESWPVRWQLAENLRRAGQRREAATELRSAAMIAPTPADAQLAWLTLGDLLYADKAYAAAFDAFRSAVAAGAGRGGRLRMAEAADQLGRFADEARALEPLADDRLVRQRLCQAQLKAREYAAASSCLDRLVAMADGDAASWRVAADLAGALGRADDRGQYLETAFRLAPQPDVGLAVGDNLLAAGRPADAAAVFGAVADQTGSPRAWVARGEALVTARQPSAAAEALAAALALPDLPPPLQARAYAALGYAQDADGNPEAAAASWQRALQLGADPGLAVVRADALLRAGRPGEATAALAAASAPRGQASSGTLRAQREALEIRLALARGDAAAASIAAEALVRVAPTAANLALLAQARAAAGDQRGALLASEQAADAAPGDAQAQAQAGYAALAAGAPAPAARRFESALAREPDRLPVRQDLPRAYALAGAWPEARRAYADAIERTAAQAARTADPRDRQALHDLRAENAAATRSFAFELVDTLCAPSSAVGCGLGLPLVQRSGSAGIGSVSASWTPHIPGDANSQRLSIYARLLWANEPGTLSAAGRTMQGGVGVRIQPFSGIPVYLWAERMIAVGRESQDNWLLRVTAGWATGTAWRASGTRDLTTGWGPYFSIYGDLGRLLINDRNWLGVLEARVGAAHQPLDQLMLVPYLFLRGELDSGRTGRASNLQIGVGTSARLRFLNDPLVGYQLEPELFVRVAHDLSRTGNRRATRFLVGIIASF